MPDFTKVCAVKTPEEAIKEALKYGFEVGYHAALESLQGLIKGANNPEARKFAKIASDLLEQMYPQAYEAYCEDVYVENFGDIPSKDFS